MGSRRNNKTLIFTAMLFFVPSCNEGVRDGNVDKINQISDTNLSERVRKDLAGDVAELPTDILIELRHDIAVALKNNPPEITSPLIDMAPEYAGNDILDVLKEIKKRGPYPGKLNAILKRAILKIENQTAGSSSQ